MSKICYLHIGLHKTASSSFQETCKINKDLLQGAGIIYPCFTCAAANRQKIYNHSIPIFSLFSENPANYNYNKRWGISSDIEQVNSSYENQLNGFLSASKNILISGESISNLSTQSLAALIEKISSYGYEIKATALARSPYSAFCSGIQQAIKGGRYCNLISLNNSVPNSFDATNSKSQLVKKLKSVFGKSICFHSFENACTHPYGPVGFLLEEFLSQDSSTFEYKRTNESLSNLSVRIQNEFNAINPIFIKNKPNPLFKRFPPKVDERLAFSGKFLLTEVEYRLVEEFFENETEKLNEIAGLDFSGQLVKFAEPIFLRNC